MSSYIEGQVHQLMDTLEEKGWTAADLTTLGQATLEKHRELRRLLHGELTIVPATPKWKIHDGLIYFEVEENGWSGEEWITWSDQNDYPLGEEAKFLLRSRAFQPGPKGTYRVAVMPGGLWTDEERTTENIRAKADQLGLKHGKAVPSSLSCLIRQKLSNAEIRQMGQAIGQDLYWIIGLHEPIVDSFGVPCLLGADADDPKPWLYAYRGKPGVRWYREYGFACVVSQ